MSSTKTLAFRTFALLDFDVGPGIGDIGLGRQEGRLDIITLALAWDTCA